MKKLTSQEYFEKCNKVHNYKYNYSKSIFVNVRTKIIIKCPVHGDFIQTALNHSKWGCQKCTYKTVSDNLIDSCKIKFNNKFDYSKVKYHNSRTKVIIVCPKHGEVTQLLYEHLHSKEGCARCGEENSKITQYKNIDICKYCEKELLPKDRYISKTANEKQKYRFHKECKPLFMRKQQLMKDYGLTMEQYYNMWEKQNQSCDICKSSLELHNPNTHVDHCHVTGKVRGILCSVCNLLLGYSLDDINILQSAINYLKKQQ